MQFVLTGFAAGCAYALVALGFVLCANVSGVINFAQGEYVMVGGLLMASLSSLSLPLPLSLMLVALVGAALGGAQERLSLAPVRDQSAFIQISITLGVAVMLRGLALLIWGKDPVSVPGFSGEGVFDVAGAVLASQDLWVWATTGLLLATTYLLLNHTDWGRAVRACSDNPHAARLMGIDTARTTLIVFAAAGAAGALAGAVVAPLALAHWSLGLEYGLKGFIGAIIGKLRHPLLAVLGGLGVGVVESLAAAYISSGSKDFVTYGILLAYLLVQGGALRGKRPALSAAGEHE
ncbi:MAG: branched-chain amino acid ABC transporter permease [Lautropia sp.]